MNTEQAVQSSIGLMQRMSENPKGVLEALDPAERVSVITELSVLAERLARVDDEAGLRHATEEVYHLIKDRLGLDELLSPQGRSVTAARERPITRRVTFEYDQRSFANDQRRRSIYAQERAAQIRNYVVQCHERLLNALPKENDRRQQ